MSPPSREGVSKFFKSENLVPWMFGLLITIIGADGERMIASQKETNVAVGDLAKVVDVNGNRVTKLEARVDAHDGLIINNRLYIVGVDNRLHQLEMTGRRTDDKVIVTPSLPRTTPISTASPDWTDATRAIFHFEKIAAPVDIKGLNP